MPRKSRAKSGPGEPVEPPRKSKRISSKFEEKQSQLAATAKETAATKRAREKKIVSSLPKSRRGNVKQKSIDPISTPEQAAHQAPKRKTSKKTQKATPVAVPARVARNRPGNSSVAQDRTEASSHRRRPDPTFISSSEGLDVAPRIVEFLHSGGYEVSDEASMPSTVKSSRKSGTRDETTKRPPGYTVKYEDKNFTDTLQDHVISVVAKKDPKIAYYKNLILGDHLNSSTTRNPVEAEIHRREDALWDMDMARCAHSNEAKFQRTIMMTMLSRRELYERLDFECEAEWKSERFPCPRDCIPKLCKITHPKPDVAVAFQAESLLPSDGINADWKRLRDFQSHIFPEGNQQFQAERAFHFFAMEAKGKLGLIDNQKAIFQNLNTASQALYNIYYCMKGANDLDTFFDEVRVFSAAATVEGFSVRIHWPLKIREEQCNNPEFPISFQFDEIARLRGDYSRAQATSIVYHILYEYGVLKLQPILKKTLEELLKLYPRQAHQSSLRDLQRAAASQETLAEVDSTPASQNSSGRKRRAPDLGDSFTSNARRRLDSTNINNSQGSGVGVEG